MAASVTAIAANVVIMTALKRGSADASVVRAVIGRGLATVSRGSTDFAAARTEPTSAIGSPAVRTCTYIHRNGVWANGVYTIGRGPSSRPWYRTSRTTPTIVRHSAE